MGTLLEVLLGPLAALECRRSLGRGWVLVVRVLAIVPPALVLLAVAWLWWFGQQMTPGFLPGAALAWGLVVLEGMFVTAALCLAPALLAGTLTGEKIRSALGLLLTTAVTPREIVMGRLAGRLCIVGVVLLAGLPSLVWFAVLCGLQPLTLASLVALPAAVAFGGGGLALAISAVARRGRDALLMAYLLEFLLLLAPFLIGNLWRDARPWIEPVNPYHAISPPDQPQDPSSALATSGLWTLLGVAGCAWAAWRLRPACLSDTGGHRQRWRLFRASRLSILGDRPMLWKELYVEQTAFSRVVKWLGILVVAIFSGSTIALSGMVLWGRLGQPDAGWSAWALTHLTDWLAWSWWMTWFIQLALGLRAAAAIASERQRGTWDGLLVSPLQGREIVLAKICGSLYALRGFLAAVALAWVASLLCGALAPGDFAELFVQTLVIGAFMVVVGIGFSLSCGSATRATTLTILCWLAAGFGIAVLAGILTGIILLAWFVSTVLHAGIPTVPSLWPVALYHGVRFLIYALAALLTASYFQSRFDALAGRSPFGSVRRISNQGTK